MLFLLGLHRLRSKLTLSKKEGFLRSVAILVGGTAFAQALSLIALPFITRLYTPSDFSVLAVYSAISVICTVVACLRFEIAIPLPEKDSEATCLLALAISCCTLVAVTVGLLFGIFSEQLASLLNQPQLKPFLWTLGPAIWMASTYVALTFWATRKKQFFSIAKTRVTQSIGSIFTQILFGLISGFGPLGLLLGQIISSGSGVLRLAKAQVAEHQTLRKSVNATSLWKVARDYQRFPKYSTFDALASSVGIHLPVIIIAAMALGPDAGYLLLATRSMAAPLGLIGGAISQVFISQAPSAARAGNLAVLTESVIRGLAKSGVGPLIFIGIVASWLFPLVFGANWGHAGKLVAWLTPWFVMQFLVNPVSMVMHVTGALRTALALQIGGLVLRVGAVVAAGVLAPKSIVLAYALSGFIFYAIHFFVVARLAGIRGSGLKRVAMSSAPIILCWIIAGVGFSIVAKGFFEGGFAQ